MFHFIKLQDFQGHESLRMDFAEGITTIVGASDVGKSAVLRALQWVCLNHLSGDDFIREGAKSVLVSLRTDAGAIQRGKGVGGNLYKLDGKEFKAFGVTVPEDIAKSLAVTELNFQGQHDSPFWFAESAPEVSRQLNAVIDLSVIDSSLSYVASEVRQANERKGFVEERVTSAQAEVDELLPQEGRIVDFAKLKEVHVKHEQTQANSRNLHALGSSIRDSSASVQTLREVAEEKKTVCGLAADALEAGGRVGVLVGLVDRISSLSKVKAPPDFSLVAGARQDWQRAVEDCDLEFLLEDIRAQTQVVREAGNELASAEGDFCKATKGRDCPLCQKPLN